MGLAVAQREHELAAAPLPALAAGAGRRAGQGRAGHVAVILAGPQPAWLEVAESGSLTDQLTLTSLVYQPFARVCR